MQLFSYNYLAIFLKIQLQEEDDTTTLWELLASHSNILIDSGYQKPTTMATLGDKKEIINTIFLHQTIYSCLAELDQLKAGLNVLGVIDEMTKTQNLLIGFFTLINTKDLTAD